MPAVKPRINVSFEEKTYKAIRRIANCTGKSASAVVSGMIEEQSVVLQQLAAALETARELQQPLSGSMTLKLALREDEVSLATGDAQEALDTLLVDLRGERADQRRKLAEKGTGAV